MGMLRAEGPLITSGRMISASCEIVMAKTHHMNGAKPPHKYTMENRFDLDIHNVGLAPFCKIGSLYAAWTIQPNAGTFSSLSSLRPLHRNGDALWTNGSKRSLDRPNPAHGTYVYVHRA